MLQVSQLCISYGTKQVVNDVSFSLNKDEILMLVGPTGCGKSTILQSLAGLIPITAGHISAERWQATANKQVPPEKRNVGMMFQDFALFPHMTVEENVSFRLKNKQPADHWLQLLGLTDFRHSKPANLSGGQKQRVALARTLAHQPDYVLLDEPLSNLDAALKDTLRWDIRNALKEAGIPAIWVTHDQNEALSVGDKLGILKDGDIQQLDQAERCFTQPANRFVAHFLGEASFITGQIDQGKVVTELGHSDYNQSQPNPNGSAPELENGTQVDVLLRPEDLSIAQVHPTQTSQASRSAEGKVIWSRFEGATRTCLVRLDSGAEVKIRTRLSECLQEGNRVSVALNTSQPLAVFHT